MKLTFVTGNKRKVDEAKLACEPAGIEINPVVLDIDEIQSSSAIEVSRAKAKAAFAEIKEPLVVTDTFWEIPSLRGFPGAYMKDIAAWFEENDFLALVNNKEDKRVFFSENISFFDGKVLKQFSKRFEGRIVEPRGVGISIENVAEFNGFTLGENRESGTVSHKPEDYVWSDFVDWYKNEYELSK